MATLMLMGRGAMVTVAHAHASRAYSAVGSFLRLACAHPLHLPGSLKFNPPGSTPFRCGLPLKWSIGGTERGPLLVKQVCTSSNRPGRVCT